jgi:hypothetical protein
VAEPRFCSGGIVIMHSVHSAQAGLHPRTSEGVYGISTPYMCGTVRVTQVDTVQAWGTRLRCRNVSFNDIWIVRSNHRGL